MTCIDQQERARDFLRDFNLKSARLRVPLSGSIDLTHRCNLKCVHCYLGDRSDQGLLTSKEMESRKILSLIDEITEAGCLYLVLTGGEPLVRKDFSALYRHAKMNGLLVIVFTNGTLISDEVIGLFDDLPPHYVEISLYGATPATYESITGVKGSFQRCMSGIRGLLGHGIEVRLKTMLMTLNMQEFEDIEQTARDLGVKFRFDAALFPCIDGGKAPLGLRVPAEEAVEKEFSGDERAISWLNYFRRTRSQPAFERLYNCGAGVTGFHISPYGMLQPCIMADHIQYDLTAGDFVKGWRDVLSPICEKKIDGAFACGRCEKRHLCGFCPAFNLQENGAEDTRSEYLCAMGNRRFALLTKANSREVENV